MRVRFAPSPTGFLHVGGVRTALFNWLYARRTGGKFLLRIEDTDLERSEDRYTQDILSSMRWLGLMPDADEPVLYQSQRLEHYKSKAEQMVADGNAYRCYCTEEEVEAMRHKATAEGRKPQYDRTCRDLKAAPAGKTAHVIRAKLPLDGAVEFEDLIHGPIRFENQELDDFVLIRTNGAPTYNLVVVVDDVETRMTHIIRGDDHINNTPKQLHLYRALRYPVPKFAHLPMILGTDKKKLSKRNGETSANVYREQGFLPEALLNFLVRLGWSHGDQEVFSIEEMAKLFDFDHVQKSAAVFNPEKLLWLNGAHIRSAQPERLLRLVLEDFSTKFSQESKARAATELGLRLTALIQPKVKLLPELAEQLAPLCEPGAVVVDPSGLKWNKKPELKAPTQAAIRAALTEWGARVSQARVARSGADAAAWGGAPSLGDLGISHVEVDAALRQWSEKYGIKLGELAEPMRLCVTGRLVSAGLFEVLPLLPWDVVAPRLEQAASL